jgi:hypothetical protein
MIQIRGPSAFYRTGQFYKLGNMFLNLLPGDQIKDMRLVSSTQGRDEKYNILVGKPEGWRPLGRPIIIYERIILKRI